MIYKDYSIPRPKNTKVISSKGNRYIYYVTGKIYNKKTKFADDKKRICIGRMIGDSNNFMPNDNYFTIFGNNTSFELVERNEHSDTVKIGAFILVRKILQDLELYQLINDVHGDDSGIIIDMIAYAIVNGTLEFQHFKNFMYNHYGLCDDIREDTYISRLMKYGIADKDVRTLMESWNSIQNRNDARVYISYDSTNMNCYGKGITLVEYGHPKVDIGLPQINLSYAIDQSRSLPLFYELYPGSITDMAQFKYMVDKVEEYGYDNIGFILDRGYYSRMNIDYISKYGYIIMIKNNNECIRRCIDKHMLKLKDLDGYIKEQSLASATEKERLFANSEEVYIHIYYDDERAAAERKHYELSVIREEEELQKLVDEKIATSERCEHYKDKFIFKYDSNHYLMGFERNNKVINDAKAHLGFFAIASNTESDARRAIEIYRERDEVEKMFMALKSGMDMDHFSVQSDQSLKSKVYIAFLASIVRSNISHRLKEYRKTNRKDYTVPAAMYELDNIEVTRNSKGQYLWKYALTAKQKNILKVFDIDEGYIDEQLKELNKRYK